jgi:RNA polymerase sigma-70 factor (ECF subfamily)
LMAGRQSGESLRLLRLIYRGGSACGASDSALVDRFVRSSGEPAEAAFAVLVERHGAMVLRVCRQVLRDSHEAEDAFQATFLVLARSAPSIRQRESLASWLHGIALRCAARLKVARARRRAMEAIAAERFAARQVVESPPTAHHTELHEEIARLREVYRAPIVLCYLQGLTYAEAADQLRWPLGTLKVRLSRARALLRRRLARLGLTPGVDVVVTVNVYPIVPRPEGDPIAAAKAIGRVTRGIPPSCSAVSNSVTTIATEVLRPMRLVKLKFAVAAGLSVAFALAVGGWHSAASQDPAAPQQTRSAEQRGPGHAEQDPLADVLVPWAVLQEVAAHAGHGEFLMYALDEAGNRVLDPEAKPGQPAQLGGIQYKEVATARSWVVVTGVVQHGKLRQRAATALRPGQGRSALPVPRKTAYRRVEIERQERALPGAWTDWEPVDEEKNDLVLLNIPEAVEERTPSEVRVDALVDHLPWLKSGKWEGIDVERLVSPDAALIPVPAGAPPAAKELGPPELMIRSIDFTVTPNRSYRYRARVVLENPAGRGRHTELLCPWSRPTAEVRVPSP